MRKILISFVLTSLVLFFPTRRFGMVTDFINWISRYDNGSVSDLSTCFGYPGLHQFFHFFNYSFYSVFGTNEWAWYFLFSILHGLNAYLVFRLTQSIFELAGQKPPTYYSLLAGFLFMCMPYAIETVVWKACLHYLITTGLILQSLRWTIKYLKRGESKYLGWVLLAYTLGLFSLELSFVFPVLSLCLLLFIKHSSNKQINVNDGLKKLILPQFGILFLYLILNLWAIGNFIGHYGAEKHFVLAPDLIIGNGLKYLTKYIFHPHFWPAALKFDLYGSLSNPVFYIPISLVIIAVYILGILKWKSIVTGYRTGIFFFTLFAISLAPIITLYFGNVLLWEGDRYGYLAAAFFVPFFLAVCLQIPWKKMGIAILICWALATIFFFGKMIHHSHKAGQLQHELLDNFRVPANTNDIYILSSPDNYRGLYLFRDYETHGDFIKKSLQYLKDIEIENKIHHISQFNAVRLTDGCKIETREDGHIVVSFDHYGSWFWQNGIGLSSYETTDFKVTKTEWNYSLEIFELQANDYLMYSKGQSWEGSFFRELD